MLLTFIWHPNSPTTTNANWTPDEFVKYASAVLATNAYNHKTN